MMNEKKKEFFDWVKTLSGYQDYSWRNCHGIAFSFNTWVNIYFPQNINPDLSFNKRDHHFYELLYKNELMELLKQYRFMKKLENSLEAKKEITKEKVKKI